MNLLFIFLFLLLNSPVFSHLSSSTQKSTMINLFKLLHEDRDIFPIMWNVSTDPCTWDYVTCNTGTNFVTGLDFSGLDIINSSFLSIPCQIESLEFLDVSKQGLDSIPDEFFTTCGKLPRLKLLDFSYNCISGPLPFFSKGFTQLESLNFNGNSLNGGIDTQLNGLVGLKRLSLGSNDFNGSIPANLGELKGLEELDLSHNNFQGRIPEQLANCLNLTILDLSDNNLVGTIPEKLVNCKNLTKLSLSRNMLVGTIPKHPLFLPKLQTVDLSHNMLVGTIPDGFLSRSNLRFVDLSHNMLVGTIPDDFLSASLQTVDLSYNMLVGTIPANFLWQSNLKFVDLSYNQLVGRIPQNISFNLLNRHSLDFTYNNLSGPIPPMLHTFEDEVFAGNPYLCGGTFTLSCHVVSSEQEQQENGSDNSIFTVGLFVSIGLGFYFGFWGLRGTLYMNDVWRYVFFNFLDTIYNRIYVTIAIYVARFRKNSQT